MAVGATGGHFREGFVLLRGYPASGGDAFSVAVTQILNHRHGSARQWVADLDDPATAGLLPSFVAGVPVGTVAFLKTHLTMEAFARRHPDLQDRIAGQVRLFRSPLDVALANHAYLSAIPGSLLEEEGSWCGFVANWLQRDGHCKAYVAAEFVSWAALIREALLEEPERATPIVDLAFDDLTLSPLRAVSTALGLDDADVLPLLVEEEARTAASPSSVSASDAFGDALADDALTKTITSCIDRFGDLVNQLIRKTCINLSLL